MWVALLALLAVAACSGSKKAEYVEYPVEEIYNEALDLIQRKQYGAATVKFDEVERQHPYSVWATRAQIMAAYAYYKNNDYDESIIYSLIYFAYVLNY